MFTKNKWLILIAVGTVLYAALVAGALIALVNFLEAGWRSGLVWPSGEDTLMNKPIVVQLIVAVMFVVVVQGCSSVKPDPNTGPNTEQGQERERMNRMLYPSPNQ